MKAWMCLRWMVLLMVLVAAVAGCASGKTADDGMKDAAGVIADGILQGMQENNYVKFSAGFDRKMLEALPENKFALLQADTKDKLGDYEGKTYIGTEKKDSYTVFLYRIRYSRDSDGVVVRLVLNKVGEKIFVAGFWMESPKLRQ